MKIKLSTVSTKYETDNKSYVRCVLKTKLTGLTGNGEGKELSPFYGLATLHKDDKFDYSKGCRIALAKAERKAYKQIGKIIKEEVKHIQELGTTMCDFIDKANKMVEHNSNYISELAKD